MNKKKRSNAKDIIASIVSTVRIMIITIISVSAIIYLIYQRHSVDNIMREIDDLSIKKKQIAMENARIQRQINELSNYARISKIAEEKIGLIPPKKRPIVVHVDRSILNKKEDPKRIALNSLMAKKELITSKSGL